MSDADQTQTAPALAAQFDAPGPRNPLIPIAADARRGEQPCGECYLKPSETCDICGARAEP